MTNPPVIATTQLTKQFGDSIAVSQVDLQVQSGEIYGLIGPNGAGKTTLIRMLATAEEPTLGTIAIGGQTLIQNQPNSEVKRRIGFLPDDFPLYDDLLVWDYLDYFARLYYLREPELNQRLQEVLVLVDLENKRDSPISTLSRGMKQRLSLARTIIHQPTLLLLDEPVSGLDPVARVQFRQTLKTLQQQGLTILISSHILSDLEDFCTSIGIMQRGQLVESSELRALYNRDQTQQLIISTVADLGPLESFLQEHSLVSECNVIPDKHRIAVTFTGTNDDIVALLRSLISANFPIIDFHRTQESLEEIFIKMGYRQTS
ncbi:MAG: ABC transporter ATP-binding protein [Acaryochloridaceae cyanobacterium CSU_3_4]|nr:ABC transporter ATP-binding protein [Acaryochloridaceae cyanobacterium CSU_3_4]